MTDKPLMPLATAVWLIENTSLSFDQIADFCKLHPLQVKGIADGDVAAGVRGINPITNNQITREELDKAEADHDYRMKLARAKTIVVEKSRKGPRYTPVSKRQNRPDAILWMVRNHPEASDAQIAKLLGTTKSTIQSVRDRTHWNSQNITPQDPVGLGLCSQIDLDNLVRKAAARKAKLHPTMDAGPTLRPASETTAPKPAEPAAEREKPIDLSKVFASLGGGKAAAEESDEDDGHYRR